MSEKIARISKRRISKRIRIRIRIRISKRSLTNTVKSQVASLRLRSTVWAEFITSYVFST